ncbi:MAG: restriction endonuclease subunit S, partial [Fluviicola sp.]
HDEKVLSKQFLYFLVGSPLALDQIMAKINSGAQGNVGKSDFEKLKIPLPPLPEQQKIAEILSTVDAKIEVIDQQITETQALKKGLMQQLLTGKLSVIEKRTLSSAEMKDSPLGEIPKSWEVLILGAVTEQIKDGTHATHKEVLGGIPLLSAKDIRNGRIYIPNDCRKLSQEDFNSIHKNFKIKNGDVLLTVVGSIGRVAVIENYDDNYTFQRSVGYIRLNNENNPYFFKQYFQSDIFLKQLLLRSNASAQAGVYLGELGKIPIVSIPLVEQIKIAEILDSVDTKLEVLSEKKTHYQELKQGLMQHLLTGKIRVNNLIAQI